MSSSAESSDSDSYVDSPDSSENECFEAGAPRGLKPYMFEPLAQTNIKERAERPATPERPVRSENPTGWCKCGCCVHGSAPVNRFCCLEDDRFHERIEDGKVEADTEFFCITRHPSFEAVCLNMDVLRVAYYQMRQNNEAERQHTEDETMRYTAYRQVIRWCYGWLGKHNRKPLPSCAMHKIRERFPAGPKGYKGFKFVDRS